MLRNFNINNSPKQPVGLKSKLQPLVLPLVTGLGAFGGFPEPPNMFKRVVKNKLIQYFLLFLLIWQGGGGQDWKLSAKVTLVIFVLITVINMFTVLKDDHQHVLISKTFNKGVIIFDIVKVS